MSLPRLIVKEIIEWGRSSDNLFDLYKVIFVNPITNEQYVYFQRKGDIGLGSVKFAVGQHFKGLNLYCEPGAMIQIDSKSEALPAIHDTYFCGKVNKVYVYHSQCYNEMLYLYKLGVKDKYSVSLQSVHSKASKLIKTPEETYTKQQIFDKFGIFDFE